LKKYTSAELGVTPIRGPFSKYLNWNETAILVTLVKSVAPKVMIEFGCNRGTTAARVLDNVPTLQRYIGVDVPANYETRLACQRSEVPDVAGCDVDDVRFFVLLADSLEVRGFYLEPCEAVFIDGDHSEAVVLHESKLARQLIRDRGIIVWHDYSNKAVEVTQVLDFLHDNEGWPIECVENSWLAFMRVENW
jgi:predicted O-methyltransferase YrrM